MTVRQIWHFNRSQWPRWCWQSDPKVSDFGNTDLTYTSLDSTIIHAPGHVTGLTPCLCIPMVTDWTAPSSHLVTQGSSAPQEQTVIKNPWLHCLLDLPPEDSTWANFQDTLWGKGLQCLRTPFLTIHCVQIKVFLKLLLLLFWKALYISHTLQICLKYVLYSRWSNISSNIVCCSWVRLGLSQFIEDKMHLCTPHDVGAVWGLGYGGDLVVMPSPLPTKKPLAVCPC